MIIIQLLYLRSFERLLARIMAWLLPENAGKLQGQKDPLLINPSLL